MGNRPSPFKQSDVKRAVAGVTAAGQKVRELVATPEGFRLILEDGEDKGKGGSVWETLTS
jgi:hypothetical protein